MVKWHSERRYMILISGSSGFLGSRLVSRLSSLGHQIVKVTQEELFQPKLLGELFEKHKPEYIFHLASYGNHSNQDDIPMTLFSNIFGVSNMLLASKDIPYKCFVNFSSSSVKLPTETFYSASKLGGEHIVNAFRTKFDKPILNVRPYSVYGEQEKAFRFIPTVCTDLLTDSLLYLDPSPVHDWIYIEDFIDGVLLGMDHPELQDLDIGTGIKTSNGDVVKKLEDLSNRKLNIVFQRGLRSYDNKDWVCDTTKLKSLGWKQKTTLEEGLKKVYEEYKKRLNS